MRMQLLLCIEAGMCYFSFVTFSYPWSEGSERDRLIAGMRRVRETTLYRASCMAMFRYPIIHEKFTFAVLVYLEKL